LFSAASLDNLERRLFEVAVLREFDMWRASSDELGLKKDGRDNPVAGSSTEGMRLPSAYESPIISAVKYYA
jgi:hypothetical protein